MNKLRFCWKFPALPAFTVLLLFAISSAHAHLMPAQRGTLNFVDDGAFLVVSLPVSAFNGVDEDGDGQWSMIEFNMHRTDIINTVTSGISLTDERGQHPLQGIMLSPVQTDNDSTGAVTQLMVMGRFALAENHDTNVLHFEMTLFGTEPAAKTLRLTATRASTDQTHMLVLSPATPGGELFPTAWQVFSDSIKYGVEHIVTGLDHLLFLLVVLATAWNWRHVVLVLTTFTIGHAISLMFGISGQVSVPAAVVEPAIAATIVGMAFYDILVRRYQWAPSSLLRLSLVFACSLVHGLGLSSALTELGLDKQNQLPRLAGFNIGIELGQLAVALLAGALAMSVMRWRGENAVATLNSTGSFAAIAIGSAWFFHRIVA